MSTESLDVLRTVLRLVADEMAMSCGRIAGRVTGEFLWLKADEWLTEAK